MTTLRRIATLTTTSEPTDEPVDLAELRDQLRVDPDDDDTLLRSILTAARVWAEEYTRQFFMRRTISLTVDAFWLNEVIDLGFERLASVDSFSYLDLNGASQNIAASSYQLDTLTYGGRLRRIDPSWPQTEADRLNAVTIAFLVGETDSDNVEQPIKRAILLMASHLYMHRGDENIEPPAAACHLLNPYRLMVV